MAGINYVELHSNNTAEAKAFYSQLFDWQFTSMPMPKGEEYQSFKTGEAMGGGLTTAKGQPMWLPYVTVPDVAKAAKKARELGGKVLTERTEIPAGIFAVVADPTGLPVALWQQKA